MKIKQLAPILLSKCSMILIALIMIVNLIMPAYLPAATVRSTSTNQQAQQETKLKTTAFAVVLVIVGVTGIILGGLSSWIDFLDSDTKRTKPKQTKELK